MRVRVQAVDFFLTDCEARLPFGFGAVTMTRAPLCTARLTLEAEEGHTHVGYSADLLVPKWFDKDPKKSVAQDRSNLLASARVAADCMTDDGKARTVFDHWWRVYRERLGIRDRDTRDRLVRGFGVALIERALMDATCRGAELSFFDALKENLFGFEPGRVFPELAGWDPGESLPDEPSTSLRIRHTVGASDRLRAADVEAGARVEDGLPQTLEEDIERYGLTRFKVKIGAGAERDRSRLLDLARIFKEKVGDPMRFTVDGNEQYEDLGALAGLFRELAQQREGAWLLERLLYVEQPLRRNATFDAHRNEALPLVSEFAPVIIDEADYGIDAFPRALELGYRGVSVKNCKGVFRALVNRGLCDLAGDGAFQSAEDLTNLPVVALQEDLATISALGLPDAERNGHHYFRGLTHLPKREAKSALAAHPDLYAQRHGEVTLGIRDGVLATGSIQCPGYGYNVEIDTAERTPVDAWLASQQG